MVQGRREHESERTRTMRGQGRNEIRYCEGRRDETRNRRVTNSKGGFLSELTNLHLARACVNKANGV